MEETDWLAERFEAERVRLAALAYRMLGSRADAEDAVQESWIRLTQADHSAVENLSGWLTTVVSRVCLDQLRSRRTRDYQPLDLEHPDQIEETSYEAGPEQQALLAESVGLAMLVVLETLKPAERVAFVLHDVFAVPFDEISAILNLSPAAARQLASRARRRVQGADVPSGSVGRQRELVAAFLAASRAGDFETLLSLLDPEVVLRADPAALELSAARKGRGAPDLAAEMRGAQAVAERFMGRAAAAQLALIEGLAGATWAPGGRPKVVFSFVTGDGKITGIHLIADPETISGLEVVLLPAVTAPSTAGDG